MKLVSNIYQSLILILFLSVISIAQDGDVRKRRGIRGKTPSKSEQIKKLHKQIDEMRRKLFKVVTSRDSIKLENESLNRIIEISDIKKIDKQFKNLEEEKDSLDVLNYKIYRILTKTQKSTIDKMINQKKKSKPKFIRYSENGKHGFRNLNNEIIIEAKFDDTFWFENNFAKVYSNKKWGIIDTTGNYIIEPKFKYVSIPYNSVSKVCKDSLWGYVDTSGSWIIKPKFHGVSQFEKNKAMVITSNDSIAYINKQGNIVSYFELHPKSKKVFTGKKILEYIRPKEQFQYLQSYANFTLGGDSSKSFSITNSPSDGESSSSIIVKKLIYDIVLIQNNGWENHKSILRIPNLNLREGIVLFIRILGHKIDSYIIEDNFANFFSNTESGRYKYRVEYSKHGYVEIIEMYD
ncbi:MAG: hypothetical protein GY936_14015 [Ignavibacteriae bacterium]|nr:hypothetical protein [Ignavibacteriota bacterium]